MDSTKIVTKKISQAAPFEIDEFGTVYRRSYTGDLKIMKQRTVCSRRYVTIRNEAGRVWSFDSARMAESMFNKPKKKYTSQDIYDLFDVRMIPDWAHYVITPYGAVFCIQPPKRGVNAGGCYMLRDFIMGKGHPYVTLYHSDGCRRNKTVRSLVIDAWGTDSALPER